ncbi:MAG TPA: NAD-binding protein, partial [Candidatus Wallbacteria bacterium]|nr:NAD-binding protein [Candidatus Wallbacteria bacterium]
MYKRIKKIRRALSRHQWVVIAVLGLAAFILGFMGFQNYYKMTSEIRSILDVAYLSVQLFALQIGDMPGIKSWEFEAARWLAPTTAAYALILAAASIFSEQIKLIRLLLLKKHVIICGLGNIGSMLAAKFLSSGRSVVIIEPDRSNPALDRFRDEGAIIINGNPGERHVLKQAGIRKAGHLIAITDDDGLNTEIAVQVNGLIRKNKNNLSSFIHISNNKLCNFFQVNGFQNEDETGANIEFFNFFHIGAKLLLNKYPLKEADNAGGRHDRVLMIGLGRIGENLIVDMARSWQKTFRETNTRLKITVVDVDARNKIDVIAVRYPGLEKVCDIEILQIDINSAEFLKAAFLFDEKGDCLIDKIYICLKIDSECMLSALRLSALTSAFNVPIIVKMNNSGGLGAVLQNKNYETGVFKNLRIFNFLEETCVPEHLINGNFERLARAFHGEYINIHGRTGKSEIKADAELADWKELSED